ncbi:hypothetical protein C2845_PM04G32040 [Panicum miliaceum]|uniref:Uncharacterized protein n=1 Tax=Panicum miliaceum TaxID=4540 RepID=A0A3L6QRP3_PANMI|nr:hypothetical protein C2845_PM04G32040 [Panicum miliaceum]
MATHAIVAAAGVAAVGALCAYFLWPAALAAAATMKAPGAGGALISRAAFEANPKLYFHPLRHAGVREALAAFDPCPLLSSPSNGASVLPTGPCPQGPPAPNSPVACVAVHALLKSRIRAAEHPCPAADLAANAKDTASLAS